MGPSITLNLGEILTWTIIGVFSGGLAGMVVRGRRLGFWMSLVTGLIGAIVGGFLLKVIDPPLSPELATGGIIIRWIDVLASFGGAVLVLLVLGMLWGWRRR